MIGAVVTIRIAVMRGVPRRLASALARQRDILDRVLHGASDANIAFGDLRRLLVRLGFEERIRGDHHIFNKDGVAEILNLEPKGSQAKPYQVKQVRGVILKYKMAGVSRAD
ncbi:MAG: type II toxin-antitoxin system HicA family toxin [Anaerolineae bacterium]|jgi:hypothetical protein